MPKCDQPGCEHDAPNPMHLGLHKKRVHGIAGTKPKKGGARRPVADRPPRASSPPKKGKYAPALEAYAGMVGMAFSAAAMARQNPQLAYDGQVIMLGATEWAQAWERLAADDPKVARVLDVVCGTTRWTEVTTATAAILVPILACHRVLPPAAAAMFVPDLGPPPDPPPRPEVDEQGYPTYPEGEVFANGHDPTVSAAGGAMAADAPHDFDGGYPPHVG